MTDDTRKLTPAEFLAQIGVTGQRPQHTASSVSDSGSTLDLDFSDLNQPAPAKPAPAAVATLEPPRPQPQPERPLRPTVTLAPPISSPALPRDAGRDRALPCP